MIGPRPTYIGALLGRASLASRPASSMVLAGGPVRRSSLEGAVIKIVGSDGGPQLSDEEDSEICNDVGELGSAVM